MSDPSPTRVLPTRQGQAQHPSMQQGSSAATKPAGETALKAEVRKTEGVGAKEALLSTSAGGKTAAPAACDQQGPHTETERREIDLTINLVMNAIVGDSGIFGVRKSAVGGLINGLEPVSDDSNLLIELIAGALGIATGGIVGLVTSRLLTAFGALATVAPHNAIGPAPKADVGSRNVTTVASSLQGILKGEAKSAATSAVGTMLQTPGEKPSVLAFVNGQIDALEALSRERQASLPAELAPLSTALHATPGGLEMARALLRTLMAAAADAKMIQTVTTLAQWSSQAHHSRCARLDIARAPSTGTFRLVGAALDGCNPAVLGVLGQRGATVKDVLHPQHGFWGLVGVDGQWSFTINKANKNYKAELQLTHIDRPYLANHGKDFYGMGFGADPQLVADIAVHRDLLGAKLGG